MNVQVWRHLLPPPRRPVPWSMAWPLVVFLLVFTGAYAGLEVSSTLIFLNPWAFLVLLAAPWIWWMHVAGASGLRGWRGGLALGSRFLMLGLFAMALADPRAVRETDRLSVIYALDLSDSMGQQSTDEALEFVTRTATQKPVTDEAGLIVFGRNAAVELPPRMSFPFEAINSRVERDATDLSKSLSLAAAMLPEENAGRIVLISDGIQTEGAIDPVLADLRSRGVSVDILPVSYQYEDEVWLERLELPKFVKLGENYQASVLLSSLKAGTGTLNIRENGNTIFEQQVDYAAGKNRFNVPVYLRESGYYEYTATITPAPGTDNLQQNNTVLDYLYIEGEGKILLVTDPQGDPRDWQILAADLRQSERVVDQKESYELPRDSISLLPYDAIVFVNVPADTVDAVQMKTIRDSVFDLGIGFAMIGGEHSFGPGGYNRTHIEDALPVSMDVSQKKILPKGALAIILHTCEFAQGNTWGKDIAKAAIEVLSDEDEVGILVYGRSGEEWLFELTPASQRNALMTKINQAVIGDMPSFDTTMKMGFDGLAASDAAAKHMIIISDGDPSPPVPTLIAKFQQQQISISMVAVFPHGGQDISKMDAIAGTTGGRYYFPEDPAELPSIFIKEARTLRRSMIQNKEVMPEVGFPSPILKGVESMPKLQGYVLTSLKPRAKAVLQVAIEEAGEEQIDPILATWRFGLGTTAAFTSDLSPNWARDWMDWRQRQPIIAQLVTDISRVRKKSHLRLWTYVQGNAGVLVVEDYHPTEAFLSLRARVSGPRDRVETVTLKQQGPRRYQARLPLWGKGRYQVLATATGDGRNESLPGGMILPYSPEYMRFRSNPLILDRIRTRTEGESLETGEREGLIYGRREPRRSSRQVFDWFLIGLACLVPCDVALRRVQIDLGMLWSLLGRGGQRQESTATMGTLLERKKSLSTALDAQRTPLDPSRAAQQRIAAKSPRVPPKPAAPTTLPSSPPESKNLDEQDPDAMSTTERLLYHKRKRKNATD